MNVSLILMYMFLCFQIKPQLMHQLLSKTRWRINHGSGVQLDTRAFFVFSGQIIKRKMWDSELSSKLSLKKILAEKIREEGCARTIGTKKQEAREEINYLTSENSRAVGRECGTQEWEVEDAEWQKKMRQSESERERERERESEGACDARVALTDVCSSS